MNKVIETRPAFVEANPELKVQHDRARRAMFGAANHAELPTSEAHKDAMLDGINEAFGYRGSQRLISRRQMTIAEMDAIKIAIEAGLFDEEWNWGFDFQISITRRRVEAEVTHIEMRDKVTDELRQSYDCVTIEPVTDNDARAFARLVNA